MRTIEEIHADIERENEERHDLWHLLSEAYDPQVVADVDPQEPDLFGLWEADEFMPDKITIFRRPLTEAFPDPAELEREIRITVLHELAHYFGLDEDQLESLGYS